jgi:thiol-disulfide isomerase/thioredoxin
LPVPLSRLAFLLPEPVTTLQVLPGPACVVEAALAAQRQDGSCRLELVYRPWVGGGGLRLDEARLHVREAGAPPCAGWPDEPFVAEDTAIVYQLHAGTSLLPVPDVSGGDKALVRGGLLQPSGAVTLKFQGRKLDFDSGQLGFGGDLPSAATAAADCGPCVGPACISPYPAFQLRDIQPKSKGFGLTYGLSAFLHKPLVVMLVAGWCPTCVYEAGPYQTLQDDLAKQGHEVAFVAINMANASAPDLQKLIWSRCRYPVLQDTPESAAFAALAGEKTDVYLFHSDGTLAQKLPLVSDVQGPGSPGYSKVRDAIVALH